jgi:hypothetical protein
MRNGQSSSASSFELNTTPVIVGAALIGAGVLIGLTGLIVGGTAMVTATRQWLGEMEVPPTEVVKQYLDQTKAATSAGANAWKEHNDTHHRARHGSHVV